MPLKPEEVQAYLSLKSLDLEAACAARAAAGDLSSTDAAKAAALGAEVQQMIAEKRMAPTVRTVYRRFAFQSDLQASVRLTLDSSLQLYKEGATATGRADAAGWCTDLDARVDELGSLRRFPHAVLEVKLATDDGPPAWLSELIASDLLQEVRMPPPPPPPPQPFSSSATPPELLLLSGYGSPPSQPMILSAPPRPLIRLSTGAKILQVSDWLCCAPRPLPRVHPRLVCLPVSPAVRLPHRLPRLDRAKPQGGRLPPRNHAPIVYREDAASASPGARRNAHGLGDRRGSVRDPRNHNQAASKRLRWRRSPPLPRAPLTFGCLVGCAHGSFGRPAGWAHRP